MSSVRRAGGCQPGDALLLGRELLLAPADPQAFAGVGAGALLGGAAQE